VPLKSGSGKETVSANIREMVEAGHPQKQAVAAAMRQAGKSRRDCPQSDYHDACKRGDAMGMQRATDRMMRGRAVK
jgi:predicted kinase